MDLQIPGWLTGAAVAVSSVGAIVFGILKNRGVKFKPTIPRFLKMIRDNFVNYEVVDSLVNSLLTRIGVPTAFRTWISSAVAHLASTVPEFGLITEEQVVDLVAGTFAKLPAKQAQTLLPSLKGLPDKDFVRRRQATAVIKSMEGFQETVKRAVANGGK